MPRIEYKHVYYKASSFIMRYERIHSELMAYLQEQGDQGWDLKAILPSAGRKSLLIFSRSAN